MSANADEALSRVFNDENLESICRWAIDYALQEYGVLPGFEGADVGMDVDSEDDEEMTRGPWSADMNRGENLMSRPNRRREDVETAIECFTRARGLIPLESHPMEWAQCSTALGVAYSEREVEGSAREDSLELAAECLSGALEHLDPASHPHQFAEIHHELGTVHLEQERGDRAKNLASSIESFQRCLEFFTEAEFPAERAQVQEKLQAAYMEAAGLLEDEAADAYADSGFYD